MAEPAASSLRGISTKGDELVDSYMPGDWREGRMLMLNVGGRKRNEVMEARATRPPHPLSLSLTLSLSLLPLTITMAEAGQPKPLPTVFAPPPSLWKHFTPENIKKLDEIKENTAEGKPKKWTPAELRALDLPPELRYLVPPAMPTESYSVFGELQSVCLSD